MKTILAVVLLAVAVGVGLWWQSPADRTDWPTYRSDKYNLTFRYPSNYFIQTKDLGFDRLTVVLIEDIPENRQVAVEQVPGRDGPVAITFDIYQNQGRLDPAIWVKENPNSNFTLSNGVLKQMTVAGRSAAMYSWDGLYPADNVVFAPDGYLISATVTYLAKNDRIRTDFYEVLETVIVD